MSSDKKDERMSYRHVFYNGLSDGSKTRMRVNKLSVLCRV